jgi:16S rRNA (guanine527-N7)-methyltransferase
MNDSVEAHPLHAELVQGLTALSLTVPDDAPRQLLAYLDLIGRWTKVYNLTAIRDPRDMLVQHLLDCLAVVTPFRRAAAAWAVERTQAAALARPFRVLDVGSGAGLPGVVLAICEPTWQVTCVDTVAKKATFIRQVAAELGLKQLQATHQRVEAMTDEPADLVTSRAFASLSDFLSLTRARLAPGGQWAAMKARLAGDELDTVPADVQVSRVEPLQVPQLSAERCIVWMQPR